MALMPNIVTVQAMTLAAPSAQVRVTGNLKLSKTFEHMSNSYKSIHHEICASDGENYQSRCHLHKANCENKNSVRVRNSSQFIFYTIRLLLQLYIYMMVLVLHAEPAKTSQMTLVSF